MTLTLEDVRRVAHLARLDLPDAKAEHMRAPLNGFFAIAQQLAAVDTAGVAPLYTPLSAIEDVTLRLRDDAADAQIDRAANQRSAPAVEDGLYLVPRVIE